MSAGSVARSDGPALSGTVAIVDGNPLENFKFLYGIGVDIYQRDGKVIHKGGVRWTIKSGIMFDAPALLQDVVNQVRQAKMQPRPTTQR